MLGKKAEVGEGVFGFVFVSHHLILFFAEIKLIFPGLCLFC